MNRTTQNPTSLPESMRCLQVRSQSTSRPPRLEGCQPGTHSTARPQGLVGSRSSQVLPGDGGGSAGTPPVLLDPSARLGRGSPAGRGMRQTLPGSSTSHRNPRLASRAGDCRLGACFNGGGGAGTGEFLWKELRRHKGRLEKGSASHVLDVARGLS